MVTIYVVKKGYKGRSAKEKCIGEIRWESEVSFQESSPSAEHWMCLVLSAISCGNMYEMSARKAH